MARIILLLAITLAFEPMPAFSQRKTYFGIEAAVTGDIYKIEDNANEIKKTPITSGLWGFTIKQEVTNNLFLETGLTRKYYSEGVNLKKFQPFRQPTQSMPG